jgi:hypothetical protein
VANRKISEFIDIPGAGIDEEDLLTLVHLAEVDPALRNKKITFTEFKNYLNAYYPNGAGGTFSGNVLINANLNVTGQSIFQSVTVSGLSVFSGIVVQNNATVSGTISGNTVTGNTLEFGTSTTVTGTFTALATGVTAAFTTGIFTNLSGTTANFTSGNFSSLSGVSCTFVSGIVVDSFTVPDGTTAERPVSPLTGNVRFNTSIAQFEGYNGTAWGAIGGGTVTSVSSSTAALTVATATTTPALTVRSATTSVDGIVQLSDSTSTTSSVLAATPTAVKSAYDLAALALPKAGGTVTGDITLGTNVGIQFEGTTDDANEIRLIGADATADRTITLPNATGTVITTGDSGTVTSTMIANGTIVNADINASAAIVDTKLATIATAGKVSNSATTATDANTASAIVARSAAGNFNITSINNGPLAGMRNAIINGNFDIWQRGTSFTDSEYGADRWFHNRLGTTHTVTRQAFTLGQTDVPGEPEYFCRTVVSSVAGAGNNSMSVQKIEGVRAFAGQQVTIGFWAKADATKNIAVELAQLFGSGGSPSTDVTAIGVSKVSIGTTFQKVTVTATVPSISGKTLGTNNDDNLALLIWFDAGSSFNARTDTLGQQSGTFDIAQVQVEPGPVDTPFERRPIGTELALCQRYFNKSYAVGTNPGTATTSGQLAESFAAAGTGGIHSIVRYPVVMRSTATVTVYNPVTGASNSARRGSGNVVPTQGSGADSGVIVIIAGGTSVDNCAHHYTASAEL